MATPKLTFIYLHYWAGAGQAWQPVADLLAPDYASLAPDLGGFGEAPAPSGGYAADAYADSIADFIRQQEVARYVLVGHSMGGKFALALAARQPVGLVGLALLSPSPPTAEPMTDADRQASLHAYGKPAEAAKTFATITARPQPPAIREQIIADNLRASKAAYDAWLLHGSRENIAARLYDVQVPCLLLTGDHDAVMSPSVHGLETLPYLPESTQFRIIGGAGHLLPYDAPAEVAALLRTFAAHL